MAAPAPTPAHRNLGYLAGEVFRTIAGSGELSNTFFHNLNYRDILSFRHISRGTLSNTLAVPQRNPPPNVSFTGHVVPLVNTNPPPHPPSTSLAGQTFNPPAPYSAPQSQAGPQILPNNIPLPLQTQLQGVSCNDQPLNGICPNRHACAWGPGYVPANRFCQERNPQTHARSPPGAHRVCMACYLTNWADLTSVREELQSLRATLCKKCSLRENKKHPNATSAEPVNLCRCADRVEAGYKCKNCMQENKRLVLAKGDATLRRLMRTHKIMDRKTRRKKLVVNTKLRTHAACPKSGCGEPAWNLKGGRARHVNLSGLATKANEHAADMCLCCREVRCQG